MSVGDPFHLPLNKLRPAHWEWIGKPDEPDDEVLVNEIDKFVIQKPRRDLDQDSALQLAREIVEFHALRLQGERKPVSLGTPGHDDQGRPTWTVGEGDLDAWAEADRANREATDTGRSPRSAPMSRKAFELVNYLLLKDVKPKVRDAILTAVAHALDVVAFATRWEQGERVTGFPNEPPTAQLSRLFRLDETSIRKLRKYESVQRLGHLRREQRVPRRRLHEIHEPLPEDVVGRVIAGSKCTDGAKKAAHKVAWRVLVVGHPDALVALAFALGLAHQHPDR